MRRKQLRRAMMVLAAGGILLAGVSRARAQQSDGDKTPPAKPAQQPAQTAPPASQPSTADQNPFPEDQSKAAQDTDQSKPKSAADANPFPEETSASAQKEANATDRNADAGPADDSSVPSSSSRDRMKGMDLLGDNDSRISNGAGGIVHNPKLASDDVRVGQVYMGVGNFEGAYGRFKEATLVDPGNAEAVFLLAEAARKTQHLDEAASNYEVYLQADPKGKHSKDAEKALKQLAGK